jgi:NAD-dependent deacetylase
MIEKAVQILRQAKSPFVLTGAGISAESGVPTFRGADGLWKNHAATDLATPQAFQRNPALVWEWYHWRQALISKAEPNPAHHALVRLEKRSAKFLLLTQNVDNLHKRAGSRNVLELHGNIFRIRCVQCGAIGVLSDEPEKTKREMPVCECGALLRPDVVWFGEAIPHNIWQAALEFLSTADVALICGTSAVVWPAAAIPEIAKQSGVKTIEINLEPTPVTNLVDVSISGKAGEILPQIVQTLNAKS